MYLNPNLQKMVDNAWNEGHNQTIRETIRKGLKKNLSFDMISELTDSSVADIQKIQQEMMKESKE